MAKRYDVRFILCEDMRVEGNGKVSLAGIYPGELIVLLQNVADAAMPPGFIAMLSRLCFVFFVKGPAGSVDVTATVYGPDRQKKIVESKSKSGQVEQGKAFTIGISGSTFPVPAIGTYMVELQLAEELHEFSFVIEAGPNFVSKTKLAAKRQSDKPKSRRLRS